MRRFQRAANLAVTGVADRRTILALKGATDGSAAKNASGGFDVRSTVTRSRSLGDRIPLRKGMSGHDVKVLQDYLKRAGFTTSVDGEYGAGTVKSVKKFEADQQVAPDGVTDAADIDLLRSLVEGDAATGTGSTAPRTVALTPGSKATHRQRRPRHRAGRRARPGQADHRRGQRDRQDAVRLRRRPRQVAGLGL